MKYKLLIGTGITALLMLLIGLQCTAQAQQPEAIKISGYVNNETGAPIGGAYVEWVNADTDELLENVTTIASGQYLMEHTFDSHVSFTSRITASKQCYLQNSTELVTESASPHGLYSVDLILEKDDIGPTITSLQPPDGSFINDNTPTICANYNDDSGINVSSVKIFVDDEDETANATAVEANYVCYTPTTALSDGLHNVTVNVSDNCTNSNSTSWSFTVDTIAPTIEFIKPPTPVNNTEVNVSYVNVSVNVTDYSSGIDNATVVMVWNETGDPIPMTEYMYAFTEGKYYCEVTNLKNGNYTYWVQANDTAGNMNVSETRVVTVNVTEYTVSVTLESGWNMIGVPLDLSNYTLPVPLSSIEGDYTDIVYYNATSGEYQSYTVGWEAFATLKELEPGAGYWINMTESSILTFEDNKFVELSRDLESGWNMFSVPYGVANKTLPSIMESIEDDYTDIVYYNATSGEYQSYTVGWEAFATLKELEPCAGYWINMTNPATFVASIV